MLRPELLPDLRHGAPLFLGLDHSGQHSSSKFEVFSMLLADLSASPLWEENRRIVRHRHLTKGRRMSFKGLNDPQKQRALVPFLNASNQIHGLCFSLAIEKGVKLTPDFEASRQNVVAGVHYPRWSRRTFDRIVLLASFSAFLLAGLSAPGQSVLWIVDEDDIAANDERVRDLTKVIGAITSNLVPHTLGHLRVGTTSVDNGSREVEDLVSIADLSAGALCDAFNSQPAGSSSVWVPLSRKVPAKTRVLLSWMGNQTSSLKHLTCLVTVGESGSNRFRWMDFYPEREADLLGIARRV